MMTQIFDPVVLARERLDAKEEARTTDVRNMLKEGLNIALIARVTGFSEEKIWNLAKEIDGVRHEV